MERLGRWQAMKFASNRQKFGRIGARRNRTISEFFWKACEGMDSMEFQRLINSSDGRGVYWWDMDEKTALIPHPSDVSWPIVWLLTFHYKHIHVHARRPQIKHIAAHAQEWARRIRWQESKRKEKEYDRIYGGKEDFSHLFAHLRSRDIRSKAPGPIADASLEFAIAAAQDRLFNACSNSLDRYQPTQSNRKRGSLKRART